VAIRTNPRVTPQAIALMVHQTHLDKPVIVRYFYWLEAIFTQKLGKSLITLKPIWPDITRTMGHTAQLIILSESLAIILGIAVGIYSAIRQYSFFDYSFTTISFLGFAMPVFWLALVLQLLFVDVYNKWHVRIVYTSGLNTIPGGPSWSLDRMQHLALPVITLLVVSFALYSRYMRASMLDVINSDYVRTARAKGVAERKVVMRHVFRNALIPITTVAALNVGGLLGGAIVTETIFTLDGMGHYFILALGQGDTYEIMAYLLVTAVIIIVFNLIADITYGFLDPRIRYD
jgi:peptide/nickel transport system permease protein